MAFLKIFLIILWLFIIPELMGLFITYFYNENNIIQSFVIGYLFCFAVCQFVAIPLIIFGFSFKLLLYLYASILIIISSISVILNKNKIKNIFFETYNNIKEFPKLLAVCAITLISIQLFVAFWYTHVDDDDAIYIGTATTTIQTNTLYKYDARDGAKYNYFQKKYALAPFSIYIAIFSEFVKIHPTILAHTILPIIFISLSYMVYGLISNELFNKNKKAVFLFLIILSFVNLWGNYSLRTSNTFLLFRIWQGKSVLANIIIPAVWLFFIKADKNDFKLIDCLILFIVNMAGTLSTTLGIGLPEIILMLESLIFGIIYKKKSYIIKSAICCLPGFIYGMIFLFI